MSTHTIQVDQFLLNKLQPEIDRLNLSLISMEENGFNNTPMNDTRSKLNKLVTYHDFLKEYAYGKEQIDDVLLNDIIKLAGAYSLSAKSRSQIVQSTRDTTDLNELGGCLDFIRIYVNNEISTSSVLSPLIEDTTLKIYGSESVNSIEVILTVTGSTPVTYTGVNHVTIQNILLDEIDGITLDITTTNVCGETLIHNEVFTVKDLSCSAATYWVGSTIERFKISTTDLNESSDISIDPNSGTNVGGTELDWNWVNDNDTEMEEFLYRENITQTFTVTGGTSHALLLVPITLTVVNVKEVVSGTPVDMTQGLHYESFSLTSPTLKQYNCYYFRDLTSLTFPERIFQFNINKV